MSLLHLDARPDFAHLGGGRDGRFGAAVSGASHLVIALLLLAAFKAASDPATPANVRTLDPTRLIWMPSRVDGGGRAGGGDRSPVPARRAQAPGESRVTMPSAPSQQAANTTVEPPPDTLPINVRPMGDATQALVGAINSESATTAPGPGSGIAGDRDGRTLGDGSVRQSGTGDGPVPAGPGVTTPVLIQQVKPQYTADAMRAKVQGSVWLECVVLRDGTVGAVKVTRSLDPVFGLDEQAIAAAKQWRFKPGLLKGQPVPVAITIELTYSLR